jgi:hypothetical protein
VMRFWSTLDARWLAQIMAASRGKVWHSTLIACSFIWAPLMLSAGTLEGISFVLWRTYDCNQRRVSSPIYRSRTGGLFSSSYGALQIWRSASRGSSEPDAEQDYILLRGYCKPAALAIWYQFPFSWKLPIVASL